MPPDDVTGADGPLRVVSYNVHRGEDDRTALARVVGALRPDLICLQEAPSWWGSARKRRDLVAAWGMVVLGASARNVVAATPATAATVDRVRRRRVWRAVLRRWKSFATGQLPGGLVEAHCSAYDLAVCTAHLGLSVPSRRREARQIVTFCAPSRRPVLLIGDLNEQLDEGGIASVLLVGGFTSVGDPEEFAPTFPTRAPDRRIDIALASSTVEGRARRIPLLEVPGLSAADLVAASDHLPLVIEVSAS